MNTYIILVCVIVAQVQASDFKAALKQVITECQAQTKASNADVENLQQHRPITSESGKCFIACLNKKFTIQDATGQLDGYATREILKSVDALSPEDYEKLNNVGDICVVEVETAVGDTAGECEIGSLWHDCIIRESVKVNLPLWLADV